LNKNESRSVLAKIVFWAVLVTLTISAAYSIAKLGLAPARHTPGTPIQKLKSDYTLMLLECLLGIVVILLPSMVERTWHIVVPNAMFIAFVLFLYAGTFLGEIRGFYYRYPNWDTFMHSLSGLMLGSLGFSIVHLLNDLKKVRISMSSLFVAFFAFVFALSLGAVWEIYEYLADGLLGLNMQKFALENGVPLIGRAALADTMEDLIIDAIGAFTASVIGYISIRRDPKWIKRITLRLDKDGQ
jgi:hypothetical protein